MPRTHSPCRLMAHRDEQVRLEFSVAIRGAADMDAAVRCKRFRRSWRCGLALLYPASDWSVCSGPSWISARMRSDSRTSLERASWVTSVRTRREDRSLHLVYPLAGLGG